MDQEHQENMAHKINYVGLIVVTDTEATITEPACMCARFVYISYGCSAWDFCSIPNSGTGGVSDSFTYVGTVLLILVALFSFNMMVCT